MFVSKAKKMDHPILKNIQILGLFMAALIFRLTYIFLIWLLDGEFINSSDSLKHVNLALNLLEHGALVNQDIAGFGRDVGRMPLYSYFLAGAFSIFGYERIWLIPLVQAFIDSLTVVSLGLIAGAINTKYAMTGALIAAAWTSLIVSSSFVLTDTIFMAFFCWGICSCLFATRHTNSIKLLTIGGILLSCALLTRPTLMFFPYVFLPIFALMLVRLSSYNWIRAILLSAIPSVIMLLSLVPWILINHSHYGSPVLTTQSGNHSLDIVDQFIRLCEPCVSENKEERMHASIAALIDKENEDNKLNPVYIDQIKREVALKTLLEIPPGVLLLGLTQASIRSLVQTGLYRTGHQLGLEPKFFSSINGDSTVHRLLSFFSEARKSTYLFSWLLGQSVAILAVMFQVVGGIVLFRKKETRPYLLFLLFLALYFLAVNGPFGNPRYSLPLAPTQIVLMAVGLYHFFLYCWPITIRTNKV
tara:strand:- start:995 stop:2413 length:1419 start_codon:yes stop_codon:yes gene_type:complete